MGVYVCLQWFVLRAKTTEVSYIKDRDSYLSTNNPSNNYGNKVY